MPHLIVVYDFESDRTALPRKFLRKYLTHVQNSVFEGSVTEGQADEIRAQLSEMRNADESVIVYDCYEPSVDRIVYGEDAKEEERFI